MYIIVTDIKSLLPVPKNLITTALFLKQTGKGYVQPKENSKIGGAAADFIGQPVCSIRLPAYHFPGWYGFKVGIWWDAVFRRS
jgi:hypothetical protein